MLPSRSSGESGGSPRFVLQNVPDELDGYPVHIKAAAISRGIAGRDQSVIYVKPRIERGLLTSDETRDDATMLDREEGPRQPLRCAFTCWIPTTSQ